MIKGISRKVDELGRIVIPKELRKSYNIVDGETELEIIGHHDGFFVKVPSKKMTLDDALVIVNHEIESNKDSYIGTGMEMLKKAIWG